MNKGKRMAKASRLLPFVNEILFREWDPIGINGNEQCRDEYLQYARTLVDLLLSGADEFKLAGRLGEIQNNSMGISQVDNERNKRIAKRLVASTEDHGIRRSGG